MKNIKETKEKIIEALEGKRILKCPSCNHSVFLRKSFARVEVIEDGDNMIDNLVDSVEDYEYSCAKCGEEIIDWD